MKRKGLSIPPSSRPTVPAHTEALLLVLASAPLASACFTGLNVHDNYRCRNGGDIARSLEVGALYTNSFVFSGTCYQADANTIEPYSNYNISLCEVVLCPQTAQKCCKSNTAGLKSRKKGPWPWIRQKGWHSGQNSVCATDYNGKVLPG